MYRESLAAAMPVEVRDSSEGLGLASVPGYLALMTLYGGFDSGLAVTMAMAC